MADIVRADKQGAPGKFWRQRASGYGYKEVGTVRDVIEVSATTSDLESAILASGDVVHTTILNFADVVPQVGGSGRITKVTILDKTFQNAALELWLAKTTFTMPAGNAAWTITDTEAATLVGVVRTATDGVYYASAANGIAVINGGLTLPLNFKCAADDTDLYGALVTRGTPTYGAVPTGLIVTLTIDRD